MSVRTLSLLATLASASVVFAQDGGEPKDKGSEEDKGKPANFEYDPVIDLKSVKYVKPEGTAGQAIEFKFDVATEVPKGSKIRFVLELNSLSIEGAEAEFTLKDESRKNLTFTIKPTKKLATEEYFLRTHFPLDLQTPAVQKAIKANSKRFPPKHDPWSTYWLKFPIKVGSPEEEAAEMKTLCETYTALMDKLVDQHNEFKDKMDAVKKGEELVKDRALDTKALTAYVTEWRNKQGAIQKELLQFQVKEPGLVQKSQKAYIMLLDFGRMLSKVSRQLLKEVTDQYKVEAINPAAPDFDASYRYKTGKEELNKRYGEIRTLVNCPPEEGEEGKPAAGPGEDAKPEGDGAKAGEGGDAKPSETPDPAPAEKQAPAKKAPDKKASDKTKKTK